MAVNPATNKIYVTNNGSASVTVIDGTTNGTTPVAVGNNPCAVAVNPATNKIYVANTGSSNTVTVIDGASNQTTPVAVGHLPFAVAVNAVTNKIYVANIEVHTVTVIDGATNATATVPVGSHPVTVAVNPVTNKVYVANSFNDNVTVIDGATNGTTTVTEGSYPYAVAVNPVTNKIYIANSVSNDVTVLTEVPVSDTRVRAEIDTLPNHSTTLARPSLAGKGVNRWVPKPTTRIEGVLNRLNSAQQSWNWAQITNGAGSDSVRWSWTWGSDSLIKGENWVLSVALESEAAITNNLGLGSPFSGNLTVYPLYRIDPPSGVETAEVKGLRGEGRITARPNPFTSFATVTGHETERFSLFDVTGRRVGTYRGDRVGEGLAPGVYFLRPEGKGSKPVRIVKLR
jgi:YVTN family beta-propeller protein